MYKVMIVDDMDIFRHYLKRLKIWDQSFAITQEAADGREALEKLRKYPVDLLLLDIKMPKMDGITFLKIISKEALSPCVVLLSDYTEYGFARQGMIYGVFDYISKSVIESELKPLLDRVELHLKNKVKDRQTVEDIREYIEKVCFTDEEVTCLIKYIRSGDERSIDRIAEMLNTIEITCCNDSQRQIWAANKLIQEIKNKILEYEVWLPLYCHFFDNNYIDQQSCSEWSTVREGTCELVKNLIALINWFIPCNDNETIMDTCRYILTNVHEKLPIKTIARKMYISKAHLSEIFKQKTGMTLLDYITRAKMEHAKILLEEGNNKYNEISFQLGYHDYGYFSKVFKKYTGVTLSSYRKQH
jgi:Response regulator containing CheY-like receiver domain and AraC-type DNA-binding domain